jgi:hypothetical protein
MRYRLEGWPVCVHRRRCRGLLAAELHGFRGMTPSRAKDLRTRASQRSSGACNNRASSVEGSATPLALDVVPFQAVRLSSCPFLDH